MEIADLASQSPSGGKGLAWGRTRASIASWTHLPSLDPRVQLSRYAVIGGVITVLAQAIYYFGVVWGGLHPNLSVAIAYVFGVTVGYFAHGWISFAGHGRRDDHKRLSARYIAVNLIGFALNRFFVWLLVQEMGGETWWPIVTNVAVTPFVTFLLHRSWTFG